MAPSGQGIDKQAMYIWDDTNKIFVAWDGVLNTGDIEIGAVELKDGDSDTRADIETDGTKNALFVQANDLDIRDLTSASDSVECIQDTAADLNMTEASAADILTAVQILDDWDESDRAKVNPIAGQAGVAAGAGAVDALTQRNTLASDDPAVVSLQIMDDWDESDRAKVNPIVGQAGIAAGTGVDGVTVTRVSLATDIALPAGTNLLGNVKISDGTETANVTAQNELNVIGTDPFIEIPAGNVTGQSGVNKFGSSPDLTNGATEEVWDGARAYVFPTSASVTHIRSAVDSAITRSVTLEVQGLDTNWDLTVQTKATDATDSTTEIALDTALRRVFRVKVLDDTTMDQDIWVGPDPATAANASAIVQAGNNQTLMAIYTIPNGKTGYLSSYYCDYVREAAKDPDSIAFSLWATDNTNGYARQLKHRKGIPKQASGFQQFFKPYYKFLQKTDVFITALASGADANPHAGFDIILVDN